jgi:hypothetical protein
MAVGNALAPRGIGGKMHFQFGVSASGEGNMRIAEIGVSSAIFLSASLVGACLTLSGARAETIVYAGYYDLAPPAGGNNNALPNPWVSSPNTTFLGDISVATSGDPDEAAVRIFNTGPSAVTLNQGFVMGGLSAWDGLIGVGGLSIPSGRNVILSGTSTQGTDGSDGVFSNENVKVILDGITYNFTDSTGVLFATGLSSANETSPWTEIGQVGATPLPAALPLFASGLCALGLFGRHRKRKKAATIAA